MQKDDFEYPWECAHCPECANHWHHLRITVDELSGEDIAECMHCEFNMGIHEKTKFIETTKDHHGFFFVCEACGEAGAMGIDRYGPKRIGCPACEASYVLWDNPLTGTPDLMCVVKPIFEEGKL